MEENGIYFYFEHSDDRHVMVLADSLSSHKPNPDIPKIPLRPNRVDRDQCLYDWIQERRYSTGKFELNDYDYAKPFKKLIASKAASEKYEKADFEAYDYPGRYDDVAKGQKFAKFRLEAEQSFDRRRYSEGHAPSLFPGSLVTVELNPVASENATYLVIRCSYLFSGQMFETSSEGSRTSFRGSYEFLRSDQQFRALPTTPRPIIYGAQTATVVGKKGDENEEISTDKSGHVWVQFHWDREQQISCPIRVAQAWAGKRWGEIFIPRVGMEVVIEFLEGDPDRPLIVGCVYNGDMPPPYDLPDHKTKAGWKSDSTKGHGGYNEVVFEDRKGHEQIGVHAQKDLDVVVLANETRAIGSDLHTTIGNSEKREIGKNFKIPVGSASRQTVVKMGDDVLDVESGNIIHNAKLKIELQVGASKITIEPWGITIDAPMITLNGAGPVTVAGLPIKLN
jgi:type VI secretion system secreted protein VgrG